MSEPIKRREFLGKIVAGGIATRLAVEAIAAEPASRPASAAARKPAHDDKVVLGRTGLRASRLGLGTGMKGWNHASNQTRLGQEKFNELVGHAFDRGITYFDMADMYGSHEYFRRAMQALKLPRERLTLMSKTVARDAEGVRKDIDRFRREIGTDYIDIVLLHCLTDRDGPDWPSKLAGAREVLSEAKEKGHIRAHGCSCHAFGAMQDAARSAWVDLDLARINPRQVKMDGTPREVVSVLRQIHDRGAAVVGMKILGEGAFVDPAVQEESLRFVLDQPCVDAFLIGFEKPAEIDEMIRRWKNAVG